MSKIKKREYLGKIKANPMKCRVCLDNKTIIHLDKKKEWKKKRCRKKYNEEF